MQDCQFEITIQGDIIIKTDKRYALQVSGQNILPKENKAEFETLDGHVNIPAVTVNHSPTLMSYSVSLKLRPTAVPLDTHFRQLP